jgi:DNA polymerase V
MCERGFCSACSLPFSAKLCFLVYFCRDAKHNIERSFYLVLVMLNTYGAVYRPAPSQCARLLPYCGTPIPAGFPSPAEGYLDDYLSLDEHLIQDQASTLLLRAKGDSMIGAHICDGDLLIVDRGRTACSGDIVVATLDDEFTLKRFVIRGRQVTLQAENPNYPAIIVSPQQSFEVFGVLVGLARQL